ncbi:unnamed protein product [Rangifer tarandus platyrhynchus]|uniref:Uncharacterized protein n=2 Tax=Rangifer tarandus platyrhynchus TaxID=3082113 RepID=A0ABN8XXV7_RANTA|nr:unnamed protein product [Rangifer tarandus platyrhynchus]
MLSFHILESVRAKQVNSHIPPPSTLLLMFHSRPSLFEKSCLPVSSPLPCLLCSPECVKYVYCSGRSNRTHMCCSPLCFKSETYLVFDTCCGSYLIIFASLPQK